MSRPPTGTVDWRKNPKTGAMQWHTRITLSTGRRSPWIPLDPSIPEDDEAGARAFSATHSAKWRTSGVVHASVKSTVSEYATKWLKSREGDVTAGTARANDAHLRVYILPVIGPLDIRKVTPGDIENLVTKLDATDRAGNTLFNAWSTCRALFHDAAKSKDKSLRVLESDPTIGVVGPERGESAKLLQFLYPSEFTTFMSCDDVPRQWRRDVAIAVYLCLRHGEQRALKWSDMDLEHGVCTVSSLVDCDTNELRDGTKSRHAGRTVPIPATLLPLLVAMHKRAKGSGLVCPDVEALDPARKFRRYLKIAGVERVALHKSSKVSKPIRYHDTRSTGATWLALAGKPASEIRDTLGHTDSKMTDRYTRAAGLLRGGRFGAPFPELPSPSALVQGAKDSIVKESSRDDTVATKPGKNGSIVRASGVTITPVTSPSATPTLPVAVPPTVTAVQSAPPAPPAPAPSVASALPPASPAVANAALPAVAATTHP